MTRFTRRDFLKIAGLGSAAAMLAACGDSTPAASGSSTPAAETPAASGSSTPAAETPAAEQTPAAPKHVANLSIGTTKKIETLSILSQSGSFGRLNYNSVVYANFFYDNAQGEVCGYFFDSYEISPDAKELKLVFPTDKIWHDGKPVTAEDVKFTFEYLRDVYGSSALKTLTEARIDSENQVTLIFSEPKAYFYVKNANLSYCVIPKHVWENVTEDPSKYTGEDATIGCGPYKLVSVDQDAAVIEYEAVPENAYLGELTVDSITLRSYSSQDALLMAMVNGEIDVMYEYANPIPYSLLDVISSNKDIADGSSDYIGCNQGVFNMKSAANASHDFREAVLKSFKWDLLTYLANGEYGETPGFGILPRACTGYDASIPAMYQDVNEAATLLDNAGYKDVNGDGWRELPDGSAFTYKICIQYSASKLEMFSRFAEVMVDSLKAVGINAYFDTESIASTEVNDKMCADEAYDIFLGYTTSGVAKFRTCFWYMVPRYAVGNSGAMQWGNTNEDPDAIAAYDMLQNAASNEEYLQAVHDLQHCAAEKLFGFAICWEKCFFPYRTDKIQGFDNYDSVGVVHSATFYQLTEI